MTYEEALEIYKLGNYGSELSKAEADYWLANIDTATELAFKCLEKQIPKKPHNVEDKYWACPNCQDLLMVRWVTYPTNPVPLEAGRAYCECCGQAIDWSEE